MIVGVAFTAWLRLIVEYVGTNRIGLRAMRENGHTLISEYPLASETKHHGSLLKVKLPALLYGLPKLRNFDKRILAYGLDLFLNGGRHQLNTKYVGERTRK